jgi:hypothetical protein
MIDLEKQLIQVKSYSEFQRKVLDSNKAALVYFSTETKKPNLSTLMRVADEHGDFMNCVWYEV